MECPAPPRILIVDDEEAILETMTFTFADLYEVVTTTDARHALALFDEQGPFAVVITDQRMPNMTGVEFLSEVYTRHPDTVRIILTGFADSEATIQAINAGHVYAYINKPWEPVELKQVVKRAVEHNRLTIENRRLVETLQEGNVFLAGVMDRLDSGAIALDAEGVVQAANRPAREYLQVSGDPRGMCMGDLLKGRVFESVGATIERVLEQEGGSFDDIDLRLDDAVHRMRVSAQALEAPDGRHLGRVLFFKEISHEPLRRGFEEIVASVAQQEGDLRPRLAQATEELRSLADCVAATGVASPGMAQLSERVSRTQTAVQSWLDVDELMHREEYPDAQLLLDRMHVAAQRWPHAYELPDRVVDLGKQVEGYYESGENSQQRVL
ncbi:MAG: response regulator [Deltaproteobacteria bacterium]|nr:response regulator [Deltaproteobacteria bacterium]MBW2417110.1 response regulator [Deltaproteobacteria bacterium]